MKNVICRSIVLIAVLLVLRAAGWSQDSPKPVKEKKAMLHVTVTGGNKAQAVRGADVIVRSGDGAFAEITNTNAQGAASISNVPFGSIMLQVAAQGWKTSGRHLDFKKEEFIQIKLESEQKEAEPAPSPTPPY
jgi:hypothetical protein